MDNVLSSVKKLFEVEPDRKIVETFAREEYEKKYPNKAQLGSWHHYKDFEIINQNSIKVIYHYGAGDMEYDGSFIVEIE